MNTCICVICFLTIVTGYPFNYLSHGTNKLKPDNQMYSFPIDKCRGIKFRMKGNNSARILLGDGSVKGSYELVVGGCDNTKSVFRECFECFREERATPTQGILDSKEVRYFWITWGSQIILGTGREFGKNTVFNRTPLTRHKIRTFGAYSWVGQPIMYIFGEDHSSQFHLYGTNQKFTNGTQEEKNVSVFRCGLMCHQQRSCGGFSYNSASGHCVLLDRVTSGEGPTVTQSGWKSWVVTFCE